MSVESTTVPAAVPSTSETEIRRQRLTNKLIAAMLAFTSLQALCLTLVLALMLQHLQAALLTVISVMAVIIGPNLLMVTGPEVVVDMQLAQLIIGLMLVFQFTLFLGSAFAAIMIGTKRLQVR
jgi:hypothetical protein